MSLPQPLQSVGVGRFGSLYWLSLSLYMPNTHLILGLNLDSALAFESRVVVGIVSEWAGERQREV